MGTPAKRQVLTDGKVLVRVALAAAVMRNSPQEEVAWAQRIAAVVPAQRPLADPISWNGSTLTVWGWLEGSQVTTADAREHGSTLRRLQELQDHRIRERLAPMLSVAARVLEAADRGDLVVSHGDAHDRNLLVLDGVVHLLDFDSAGMAHRHVDVASGVYAWRLNHQDESAVCAFLEGYGEHPDLDRSSLDSLVWVRRVRATCTRAAAGQDVSRRLVELEAAAPHL